LLTPRVRKSAQYNVAAKMPNAVAMKRTMIVSVGMGGSLCFWGTMMLAALVEALILIKFRAHPLPDLSGWRGSSPQVRRAARVDTLPGGHCHRRHAQRSKLHSIRLPRRGGHLYGFDPICDISAQFLL